MENDFKISFLLSLFVHVALFVLLSLPSRRSVYVSVPIEVFFSGAPSLPSPAAPAANDELIKKEEKEIIIPKKVKAKPKSVKKESVKKNEQPKTEEKSQSKTAPGRENMSRPSAPSSAISLDAVRFPYAYYTNTIVRKIGRFWQWSADYGRMKTVLYFKIGRDGTISGVEVKTSSGDRLYDQQAERAVKLASPFPPLPDGFDGETLGVYFEFSFKE